MAAYAFEGVTPVVNPGAWVHDAAVLIGDVWIGAGCFVGPGAVLRGDFGRIVLEDDANLQDNCVVHSLPDFDCVMESRSHVGHGAVIHAARLEQDVLIGMNAVIMDRAVIGAKSIVAASSFVRIGDRIAPRMLVAGVPARVVRELSEADIARKAGGTDLYIELARRCAAGLHPAEPLTQANPDRERTRWRF